MENKLYIGIDPGLNGGIAFVKNYKLLAAHQIPLIADKVIDYGTLFDLIANHLDNCNDVYCCIEKVHSMQHWGVKNNFSFGGYFHAKRALLDILEVPYTEIQSKKWQSKMFEGVTRVSDGKGGCNTKKTAEIAVKKLFPSVDFRKDGATLRTKKIHDGKVDAALIALYASRNF